MADERQRPRVLVLGGGFAGVGCGARAEEGGRGRRGRRQARLPHLPAAPLPGRDGPAGAGGGRAPAARPLRRPEERPRPRRLRHRDRPRPPRGPVRGDEAHVLRLPRARARRRGQLLRRLRRSGARVPDVHARRRRPSEDPRAGEVGGRGQGRLARRGRRTAHRRRRRRPHRGGERRRAGGAVQQHLRRGLPGCVEGAREDHARRGLAAALRDVQGEPPRVHEEGRSRSSASRSSSARSSSPSSRHA